MSKLFAITITIMNFLFIILLRNKRGVIIIDIAFYFNLILLLLSALRGDMKDE